MINIYNHVPLLLNLKFENASGMAPMAGARRLYGFALKLLAACLVVLELKCVFGCADRSGIVAQCNKPGKKKQAPKSLFQN